MKKFAFPWSKPSNELRILPIRFYDQIRCIFRLSGTLRAGNIITPEFVHTLPCIDRVAVYSCNRVCKIFLIPAAVPAVFRLAIDDVADNAVNLVWLLHQRCVAAACTIACCDRWTYFTGLPDSRINAVVFKMDVLVFFKYGFTVLVQFNTQTICRFNGGDFYMVGLDITSLYV